MHTDSGMTGISLSGYMPYMTVASLEMSDEPFIQRRGRVLRTHKDKRYAIIHDLVVIPETNFDSECYELEKSLVSTEIKRVRDFALLSENCNDTLNTLDEILNRYKISLFN